MTSRTSTKPRRDPNVTDVEVVPPTQGRNVPVDVDPADVPPPAPLMPTAENARKYQFTPGQGCTIPDVLEVALAYLLMLTNSATNFEKGTLRRLALDGHIYDKLSDDAAQWFAEVQVGARAPASPPSNDRGA